jgi:stress response protein YsnF
VVKEEIRVRKDVGEEEEVIEEDVRKEEIDVEDYPPRVAAAARRFSTTQRPGTTTGKHPPRFVG